MKNAFLLALTFSLLVACGRSEKTTESTTVSKADSIATESPTPKNCKTVIDADKLGKSDVYQESAKSIKVALTLTQDTSSTETSAGCYFNNAITVLATKKSGSQLFKRTLLKDDLLYFIKSDDVVERSVLKTVTYKPTFNSQRYINLVMRVIDPVSQKTSDYTLFMNYFGEIVKVK
ncbi:hypothetical protein [Spirosoma gilvum]